MLSLLDSFVGWGDKDTKLPLLLVFIPGFKKGEGSSFTFR
jgi:hypothetical protein